MASVITTGSTQASGGTNKGGKAVWSGRIIGSTPTQAEPLNIGFGQGSGTASHTQTTALVTDLGLVGEIAAPSGTNTNTGQSARVAGTSSQVTTTGGNYLDTYQVVGTITAGTALAVNEAALFDTNAFPGQTSVATVTSTFLAGTTTGGGTATVASSTGLPTAASNYQVDSEVITASLSGTTLTATARGVNGTTAAAHAANCVLTVVTPTGTGGGGVCAAKGDFSVINLATNDTLQLTAKVQFT